MSTHNVWYAAQAKVNPDLFRVIFDFNRRPQFWLHPAVARTLPEAPLVNILASSRHGQGHLAVWLERALGLEAHAPVWDFEEPRRRLTLLGPQALARLAKFAGAALTWPAIVSVIGKSQMQEIRSDLGEDAHAFALRRARLLVPEKDAVLPEANAPLVAHALDLGWNLVTTAAYDELDAIRNRFTLKLPPAVAEKFRRRVDPEVRERAWSRIRQISREVLTEGEQKCFA